MNFDYPAKMIKLHKSSLAYASTSLAASSMNSLFFFYYVKLFLDKYHVSQPWFQLSQVVYMIWNAVNDPLVGYFQDNSKLELFRERRKSILYGAPVYALCFLLPWFAWGDYQPGGWLAGFHLMVSLCAYDALLTFVLLAQCALFTEMSQKHEDRLRLVKYQQVASMIGSSSVFLSSLVSHNMEYFGRLQLFCLLIAGIAWYCMRYTGIHAHTNYDPMATSKEPLLSNSDLESQQDQPELGFKDAAKITWQIIKNRNFLSFVFMNFFQVFHTAFGSGFLIIFADHLIPSDVLAPIARSAVYGASFFLPQVMVILGGDIIRKVGSFQVILGSFIIQCTMSVILYIMGRECYWLLAFYFIFDLSIPHAMFSLFNIPLSDIIDQDKVINNVKQPRSAMVFGTNALITKPAQSLAPMLVVTVLNWYNYESLKESGVPKSAGEAGYAETGDIDSLHDTMFVLLCFLPFTVSLLQFLIWSRYQLRNTHTVEAKYVET